MSIARTCVRVAQGPPSCRPRRLVCPCPRACRLARRSPVACVPYVASGMLAPLAATAAPAQELWSAGRTRGGWAGHGRPSQPHQDAVPPSRCLTGPAQSTGVGRHRRGHATVAGRPAPANVHNRGDSAPSGDSGDAWADLYARDDRVGDGHLLAAPQRRFVTPCASHVRGRPADAVDTGGWGAPPSERARARACAQSTPCHPAHHSRLGGTDPLLTALLLPH